MLSTPASPPSFQWPPKTISPDVVSWRNTDHLKYDFAPYDNPNNQRNNPNIENELEYESR